MSRGGRSIALKYDASYPAPLVVAKGAGLLAEKLRRLAEEHGVPVVERGNLAESLFVIETGHFIPEPFYMVVAEVLAYVFRSQGRDVDRRTEIEKKVHE